MHVSDDREFARLRQDEHRESGSQSGYTDHTASDGFAVSFRVKPDRRSLVTHIDPGCERRRRR
jgi:hypothetical protein